VARRQMSPIRSLLPSVLASLARETGDARALGALWEEAVGPAIARAARPRALRGSTLVVEVASARWASELEGRERELCERLGERLGTAVRRLEFRLEAAE